MNIMPQIAIFLLAGVALVNCDGDADGPVTRGSEGALKYIAAKQEFTEAIAGAIARQNDTYRIVAINGPQYRIGTALDPDNPADVLSTACPVAEPDPVPWSPIPGSQNSRTISFDSELPSAIVDRIGIIESLGVDFENQRTGVFSLTDISQRLAPQDDFNAALQSEACRVVTSGRDTVFVRGIIYAKEKFSSGRNLSGGVNAAALGSNLLVLRYDNEGSFEIEDSQAIPRFHVVTLVKAESDDLGAGSGRIEDRFEAPSAEMLERIESAGL